MLLRPGETPRYGGVPRRLLHQMDGRAPIKAVAGVRVVQPVGRDLGRKPGL